MKNLGKAKRGNNRKAKRAGMQDPLMAMIVQSIMRQLRSALGVPEETQAGHIEYVLYKDKAVVTISDDSTRPIIRYQAGRATYVDRRLCTREQWDRAALARNN